MLVIAIFLFFCLSLMYVLVRTKHATTFLENSYYNFFHTISINLSKILFSILKSLPWNAIQYSSDLLQILGNSQIYKCSFLERYMIVISRNHHFSFTFIFTTKAGHICTKICKPYNLVRKRELEILCVNHAPATLNFTSPDIFDSPLLFNDCVFTGECFTYILSIMGTTTITKITFFKK